MQKTIDIGTLSERHPDGAQAQSRETGPPEWREEWCWLGAWLRVDAPIAKGYSRGLKAHGLAKVGGGIAMRGGERRRIRTARAGAWVPMLQLENPPC